MAPSGPHQATQGQGKGIPQICHREKKRSQPVLHRRLGNQRLLLASGHAQAMPQRHAGWTRAESNLRAYRTSIIRFQYPIPTSSLSVSLHAFDTSDVPLL